MTDKSALELAPCVSLEMVCDYWRDLYITNVNDIDELIQLRWMLSGLHQFSNIGYAAMNDIHLLGKIAGDRLDEITKRMREAA